MSWVPINQGQPHSTTNYQDLNQPLYGLNEYDHHFLDLSTPLYDHNDFNLTFDTHHLNQNPYPPLDHITNNNNDNNTNNNNNACLALPSDVPEIPDTCFNYITELLRDDNPKDETLGTLQEYMAYQSYYQSLTDTLSGSNPQPQTQHSSNRIPPSSSNRSSCLQFVQQAPQQNVSNIFCSSSHGSNSLGSSAEDCFLESQSNLINPSLLQSSLSHFPLLQQALLPPNLDLNKATDHLTTPNNIVIRIRKHPHNEDGDDDEERRSKLNSTASPETYNQISEYEENIFCPEGKLDQQKNPSVCNNQQNQIQIQNQKNKSKSKNKKNQGVRKPKSQVVDLMSLLLNCAESVSRMDLNAARDQLALIRKHSSPYGDNLQRFSHYTVNALDQRLSSSPPLRQIPSSTEFLRASRIYVAAAPFNIMSYYVANKTICRLVGNAARIHIIDFGIAYGLQWPCIIYNISKVEPAPPRLRITGIDFPESGFRPGRRLEETGRCLKRYGERFKVEVEYTAIVAEKWESVTVEEIGVRRDEFTVVNSLYRSQQLYDESVEDENSPRDAFLEVVRMIKPDCFVHGVVHGNLNSPFFKMRFKEVLAHYAALFEVLEVTMPREDSDRTILEGKIFGETLCNLVACEGKERIERPETYRRWHARKTRVGFWQVPLETELMRRAKAMVQMSFRKEFMMDEDCGWAVQGWKGRVLYAVSCWRPQD